MGLETGLKDNLKGVLFDLDGVLINSMEYHVKSFEKLFEEMGVEIQPEEIYKREGSPGEFFISEILEDRGINLSKERVEELAERRREIFKELDRTGAYPEMKKLLGKLKEKYRLGLVSGSNRETVMRFVEKFFSGIFTSVVSAEDTEEEKPEPDPWLKCLEELNLTRDDVIAVENSPLGVESVLNAGIRCLAVSTYLPAETLSEADYVFESHSELVEFMRRELDV